MQSNFSIGFEFGAGVFIAAVIVVAIAGAAAYIAGRTIQAGIALYVEHKRRVAAERRKAAETARLKAKRAAQATHAATKIAIVHDLSGDRPVTGPAVYAKRGVGAHRG